MNIHANVLNTSAADSFLDNIRKDVLKITGDALKENSIHNVASSYATQDSATKRMLTSAVTYAEESLQKYNVLIEGPSGTGKELLAKILAHKRKPLSQNSSAICPVLLPALNHGATWAFSVQSARALLSSMR